MRQLLTYGLMLIACNSLFGQADSGFVSGSNMKVLVQSNGTFFAQQNGNPFAHYPENEEKNMFAFSGPWLLGLVQDTIYANRNIRVSQPQMWAGPIDTATHLPKDAFDWAHVWEINRAEVDYHQQHFGDAGYKVPEHIENWPSSHSDNNVNAYLAPFIDHNANGIYDPENGDYPSFVGDYAAYFICNDLYGENVLPKSNKLGIEFQGLIYSFEGEDQEGIVFVKLYLINRSVNDYAPFFYGQYTDFELGNPGDNLVATDVSKSLVYAYNGDNEDEGDYGYGKTLPAAGCVFLNQKLYASCSFTASDSIREFPKTEKEMYEVMLGNWRNGSAKYALGTGVDEVSGKETQFIYPKKTDPDVAGDNWTDGKDGIVPGKRDGLGVIRFEQLPSGGFKQIDYAFIVDTDENDPESGLFYKVQKARVFHKTYLSVSSVSKVGAFDVYPNPLNLNKTNVLHINAEHAELWNLQGVKMCDLQRLGANSKKFEVPCNESLSSGVYFVKAITKAGTAAKRLVVTAN